MCGCRPGRQPQPVCTVSDAGGCAATAAGRRAQRLSPRPRGTGGRERPPPGQPDVLRRSRMAGCRQPSEPKSTEPNSSEPNRPELSTSSGAKRPPLIWKKAVCSGAGPNSSPEPRQGSDGRLFARPEQPLIGGKPRDQIEAPAQDRICVPWGRFGTSGHPEDQRREAPWPIVQKQ